MKTWALNSMNVVLTILVGAGLSLIPVAEGWAQEKCKRTGTNLAQDTKYVQQHVIDVRDVPGHQVRSWSFTTPLPMPSIWAPVSASVSASRTTVVGYVA